MRDANTPDALLVTIPAVLMLEMVTALPVIVPDSVSAVLKAGAAPLPVLLLNTVFAPAFESVKETDALAVGLVTEEVNRGERVPTATLVTVPVPAGVLHVPSPRRKVVEEAEPLASNPNRVDEGAL